MIASGFFIGLLGSLHCVGMCGPIALGLPGKGQVGWRFYKGRLLYNLGRITTYAGLGAVAGLLGIGAAMFQLQQAFSLLLGILLVLWGLSELFGVRFPARWNLAGRMGQAVRNAFGHWFGRGGPRALYMIGVMNGLLPCGLVWLGLISAALTPSPLHGMGLMALFGLGTFPLMFGLAVTGKMASAQLRSRINRIIPYTVVFFGLVFMLRGMNLGIPYLSPALVLDVPSVEATVSCCHR